MKSYIFFLFSIQRIQDKPQSDKQQQMRRRELGDTRPFEEMLENRTIWRLL
jgi:hypothetical protein